eukprot:Transcript_18581.p1 GENE.Transcript_18581~~Transcript_18581.p1  ORF type:complete len:297 (-),score=102.67 Transcript_18581:98-988(-)
MLYADKNALRTQLKVNMLRIRERELLFFTNNCLSISTSAVPPPARGCRLPRGECTHLNTHSTRAQALLAGFAWYGLTEVPFDLGADVVRALASPRPRVDVRTAPSAYPRAMQVIQTLYLVVTTLIMGLELLTVVNATLCAILGPGLALRGPDGSMHNAVNGMMTHYKFTFACFTAGLLCFHISALLYAWMQFDWDLALPVSLLLMYFLWTVWRYFRRIVKRFQLQPTSVVTGAFGNDSSAGEQPAPSAEQLAREQQEREEQEQLRQQYANLPESVKASMGMGGPSDAGPSGVSQHG